MIISGTGHRPHKLGGYDLKVFERLVALAEQALLKYQPATVISGMALGWDQALAQAATNLGIPWLAAIPCRGQESKWHGDSKHYYHELLTHATWKVCLSVRYTSGCMQRRNEFMVNKADMILALWDGSPGGTANCIKVAETAGKTVINLHSSWMKYR
jgi:uncharacterized phage-like protein YoqJ